MSMEINVFFHGELPTREKITATMQELGFAFAIDPQDEPLDKQIGFMPMTYQGEVTGCEFAVWEGRKAIEEIVEDFAGDDFNPAYDRTVSMVWGSSAMEGAAACSVAAALLKLTGGAVFDCDARFRSLDEAVSDAREMMEFALEEAGKSS